MYEYMDDRILALRLNRSAMYVTGDFNAYEWKDWLTCTKRRWVLVLPWSWQEGSEWILPSLPVELHSDHHSQVWVELKWRKFEKIVKLELTEKYPGFDLDQLS